MGPDRDVPAEPNAEQITYWNDTAGPKWVVLQAVIDEQIRPLGERAMDRADLRPGLQVLDIGCGCGDSTLELARRVAPGGTVMGVDVSAVMLARARAQARASGAAAHFQQADAQTHAFEAHGADVVFSRFGVMFFADPTAAFTNLRRALRDDGRVVFVCWQALAENPWMVVPLTAALPLLEPPPPLPAPDAPGPFAFADPEKVRAILDGAGFRDVQLESVHAELTIGGGAGLDETANFLVQMGPAAAVLRDTNDPDLLRRVTTAIRDALAPYQTPRGVRMQSASWIVTGRA